MRSIARPTIDEARWLRISSLAKRWKRSGLIESDELARIRAAPMQWRESSVRIVLFVLTMLGVAALYFFFKEIGLPAGILTAITACGIAELLIWRRGFLHVGAEEALLLGGLFALIAGLPGPARDEGLLLFAAASLFVGWRVMNELFVVASFVFVAGYLAAKLDAPSVAFVFCIAMALAGAVIVARRIRDPWVYYSAAWMVVAMPLTAFLFARLNERSPDTAPSGGYRGYVATLAVLSVVLVARGLTTRARSILVSGLLLAAAAALQASLFLDVRSELLLMGWGALILTIAGLLIRLLRDRETGLTAQPAGALRVPEMSPILAAPLLGHSTVEDASTLPEGGGSFGGAGSSGGY